MGKRGTKPLPTATLRLRGSWRPSKHAGRLDEVPPQGVPERPEGLDGPAGELWERIANEHQHRGTLGNIDTAALLALCRTWGLYLRALAAAEDKPCDKDARCSCLAYLALVDKLGAKFGWTPSDRANVKAAAAPADSKSIKPRERA